MIPRVELSKQLKKLISKHPSLSFDKESGKIQCSLSGHEMPGRADAVNSYVQGKKYLKLKARQEQNFEKYKPHLVPSSKKHHEYGLKHQLFCVLTLSHVNKTPAHVERHVNGAKFKRAMAR
ncbi:SURF2-like protein, partial [Mya arenaria]